MTHPALPSRNDCLSRLMIASPVMTLKNSQATVEQSRRHRLWHELIAKAMPKPRQIVASQRRPEIRLEAGNVRGCTEMTRLHFSFALIRFISGKLKWPSKSSKISDAVFVGTADPQSPRSGECTCRQSKSTSLGAICDGRRWYSF
jgi:hypothetical protein